MRALVTALAMWLCGSAFADVSGWTLRREGEQFALQIADGAPVPSVADVARAISESMVGDLPPEARRGTVLVEFESGYPEVGRLTNDITRAGALGERTVVLPAGTPMFRSGYSYRVMTSTSETVHDLRWSTWCGVAPAGSAQAGGGYCVLERQRGAGLAEIRNSPSLYVPQDLGPVTPTEDAVVRPDESVRAELPSLTYAYVVDGWSRRSVRVRQQVSVNGVLAAEARRELPRDDDGGAVLDINMAAVQLAPGQDEQVLQVSLAPPNEAARAFAAELVTGAQSRRAGR